MSSDGGRSDDFTPIAAAEPGPHPLASALAVSLEGHPIPARVLMLGIGSGRNVPVLLHAGARIDIVDDDPERNARAERRFGNERNVRIACAQYGATLPFQSGFVAALSTHALLHGTPAHVAATIAAVRCSLLPGATFYATLGSKRDPRFGSGRAMAPDTFAPTAGSERGVAHAFFDEAGARAAFAGFDIETLHETSGADTVGRWAHDDEEADPIVHWHVRARRVQ